MLEEKKRLLARGRNCMSSIPAGLRGLPPGITMPEITKMQARAIIEAACELAKEGTKIVPEIMIPLVGYGVGNEGTKGFLCAKRPQKP